MTGVLEAEFLYLQDEDIIKQLTDFDDSMGSWITNIVFLLNNRNGLRRGHNSAITTGLASLPISTQNSQIEFVFQCMRTIGTLTDTLEYARKHRYLLKTSSRNQSKTHFLYLRATRNWRSGYQGWYQTRSTSKRRYSRNHQNLSTETESDLSPIWRRKKFLRLSEHSIRSSVKRR